MSGTWKRWQDWLTVVIGVLLFVAPFALGATANQAAVTGVLVFLTPWALGFTGLTAMAWSVWVAGILAVVLAGSVVLNERGRAQLVGQR